MLDSEVQKQRNENTIPGCHNFDNDDISTKRKKAGTQPSYGFVPVF
jgi:nitrate/TMAO reductase-like tetraheme cytochrome c subunit